MIIKFIPSPNLKVIVKAFYSKISSGSAWKNINDNVTFYSRGTWALYNGVIQALELKGKKNGVVWFPAYFCNEVLDPLRDKNIVLNFYPIKTNLEPDWDYLNNKLIKSPADVFVIVHYFGFIFPVDKANEICKKFNMVLIEDGAHVLNKTTAIGNNFRIYSPRKILAVPEIGILISKKPINNKVNLNKINTILFFWIFKYFTQYILSLFNFNWHSFNANNNNTIKNTKSISHQQFPTKFSLKLLNLHEKNINIYAKSRLRNYLMIDKSISKMNNIEPLFKILPKEYAPYVFPLIVKGDVSIIKNKLLHDGIPVTNWPELPLEVLQLSSDYNYSIWLSKHLLLLPVHQSLKTKEINYIVSSLKKIINAVK